MHSFDHITASGLKSDVISEFSMPVFLRFPTKLQSLLAHDTVFGDFSDSYVCAFAVSALILLPVVKLSPATLIMRRKNLNVCDTHTRLLLPVLLIVELGFCRHMCDQT